jgi:hypothetical protein
MRFLKKIILISFILLLICLVSAYSLIKNKRGISNINLGKRVNVSPTNKAVSYFSEITKDSTDFPGWKRYRNPYYEIQFPSSYSFSNEAISTNGNKIIDLMSPLNPNRGGGYELKNGELKIEIYFEPYTKSLYEYVSSKKIGVDVPTGTTFQNTNLNGFPSVYSISHYSSGAEIYYIIHRNYLFSIAKYPLTTTRKDEYTAILSTFKFAN